MTPLSISAAIMNQRTRRADDGCQGKAGRAASR